MKLDRKFLSFYYDDVDEFPDYIINKKRTMLLIIDLQKEFCLDSFGEALEFKSQGVWDKWKPHYDQLKNVTIPNAKKLLDYFRHNEIPVSFGRIACLREDGEDRSPVQKSEGWNNMLMPVNSYSAEMVDELMPTKNEIVVNKTTDSVTTGTNYLQILDFMGIETVVVCGIVTDQCVASTVRGLADAGYKVITVHDACAAPDMNLHNQELTIMNVIYTYVMSTDDTIELLNKSK
ncbi:MAG: cysteine hydrolase [Peptoniphilus lacrimalis]|uniref:cysteine hydrolase family protein n=1 Tax=Peptoniphilus lacrimalis TaxID=33031 RepID=UPI0023F6801F|nr:cysteine hydrolase [Peptoniphilus lacrimalis]MDK8282065.1 cysteine hydrolase [Peptoniphilus lacrimalis]